MKSTENQIIDSLENTEAERSENKPADQKYTSPYAKRISKRTRIKEKIIKYFFALHGFTAVVFILLIFIFLFKEAWGAFNHIGLVDFLYQESSQTGNKIYEWYPTSENARYSLIPLILGTLITAIPATLISTIFGIAAGIYLSEIAEGKMREFLKPAIELFAGIPTVVLGFFMLVVGATFFQDLLNPANRLNAFLAALGLSLVIIPIIASLTEDALHSIPNEMRMAAYGLGATKWQTIRRVILPAAISGVSAGIILGFGRAIGETMIVLMASGNAANLFVELFRSVRTMTATIAAEMGEVSHHSDHYYALFFIGVVLFTITFILNLFAEIIINKMRKKIKF